MINSWLQRFESLRPFTEKEAWNLFWIAAIGEACGWTLLILGILCKQYILRGNNAPVMIAGQIHGMLFFIYIVAALGLYPSMGWRRPQAIVAGLASVPPYGSIIFEQWAAHRRRRAQLSVRNRCLLYAAILEGESGA